MSELPGWHGLPDALATRMLEAAEEGIALLHGAPPDERIAWCNPAFARLTGLARDSLVGSTLRAVHGADAEQAGIVTLREAMQHERSCSVLVRSQRPDGEPYWSRLRVEPCRDAESGPSWLLFGVDVSAQREMEILLGRAGDEADPTRRTAVEAEPVDRLTGLQSEPSFDLALELAWFGCARDRRPIALFAFAPDYFDVYLETFGRGPGDSCLRMLARSVGTAFRRSSDVVARVCDAEFVALGLDMKDEMLEPHARRVCDRVRALAIRNPHAPVTRDLTMSAVVLRAFPGQAHDWRGLLREGRARLASVQAGGIEQVLVADYVPSAD
jgi:diguanylate cyclase (GGDEF)-like protein/PAS domain S-box-containing protein